MANASSGAAVNDQCVVKYNELQAKRQHRFVTYKLENSKEIVVDAIGERALGYDDFIAVLPENDCRFAIFDFDFVSPEDLVKSKIFYIFWSPDTAKVRSKMLYASSNSKFKQTLTGIHVDMQATDSTEVSVDALKERIKDRIKGRDV